MLPKKFIFIVQNRKLRKIEINLITRFEGIYVISGNIKENDIVKIEYTKNEKIKGEAFRTDDIIYIN